MTKSSKRRYKQTEPHQPTRQTGEIPKDWSTFLLKDLTSHVIDNRGKTPPTQDKGVELLEVNAIVAGEKFPNYSKVRKYVSNKTHSSWFRSGHPKKDDILVPTVGTIGSAAIMKEGRGTIAQNLIGLRINSSISSPNFIYYLLTGPQLKEPLLNLNIGGVQPSIKVPHLLNLQIGIPSLDKQEKIASILSSLDEKIELNRRMNKTLEEIGQALFKHWFVDFNFPDKNGNPYKEAGGRMIDSELGKIPEGWEVERIEEVCCGVSNGGTPSRGNKRYWDGGHINWYKTGELRDTVLFESEEKITAEGLENSSAKLLPEDSIVVAIYAAPTVGRLGILKSEAATNQACTGLVANRNLISHLHIYYWLLSNRDFYNRVATGAAQQNISGGVIADTLVVLPTKGTIDKSYKYLSVLWDKITANERQISHLEQIRDSLLPRLVGGRLRVN